MDAIALMVKAPVADKVKTRLIPPLNSEIASELYKSFVLDKIEQLKILGGVHRFLAYTPESSETYFKSIAPKDFTLINQIGSDLGEKLINVSTTLFQQGFKKVVLSDSDTPNLPPELMIDAFRRLDSFDVVLGPCEDGGYYLIGLRSNMPELFREIPWSTASVTEFTTRRAMESHVTLTLLDKWYDIDTVQALSRLKKDLESKPRIGFFCRNSYRTLSKIDI